MPIRLVLADDHPIVLEGLVSLFRTEPDFEVLAACKDGEEALEALRQYRPDVLVLDLRMPGRDGCAVLRAMQQLEPGGTRAVVLTAATEEHEIFEAIRLGVRGVVLKEMAPRFLVQCVRKVATGAVWLERHSTGRALEALLKREAGAREAAVVLTARELQVVRMVASGMRNKEIARALSISEGTVKMHLHNIYDKTEVDGRLALVVYAREKGLL